MLSRTVLSPASLHLCIKALGQVLTTTGFTVGITANAPFRRYITQMSTHPLHTLQEPSSLYRDSVYN